MGSQCFALFFERTVYNFLQYFIKHNNKIKINIKNDMLEFQLVYQQIFTEKHVFLFIDMILSKMQNNNSMS